jgi:hypothetical protein
MTRVVAARRAWWRCRWRPCSPPQPTHRDDRVTEGAARLFSGLEFGRCRSDDRAALPADLKRRLLEHVERSENEDNHARARAAFGG